MSLTMFAITSIRAACCARMRESCIDLHDTVALCDIALGIPAGFAPLPDPVAARMMKLTAAEANAELEARQKPVWPKRATRRATP